MKDGQQQSCYTCKRKTERKKDRKKERKKERKKKKELKLEEVHTISAMPESKLRPLGIKRCGTR